jgi:hypothetical protein
MGWYSGIRIVAMDLKDADLAAVVRCQRCAHHHPHRTPTVLAAAALVLDAPGREGSLEVVVVTERRRGSRAVTKGPLSKRQQPSGYWYGAKTVKMVCPSCGVHLDVIRKKLRPLLEKGYRTILVGPNGEMITSG